ncbi:hypothetical protein [Pseudomonas trivialis]|uniref:Uncharacterized protein n=1 Tax=Pseudomonas trivialis TaxID=200450 RepID=A0ABY0UHD1_9PSED|nr:hypothetical protein [Pseudomonas trivialis]SDS68590.1 hypothetical protein SAMN04490205_3293 [Pseudomonas trivialis]
MTTNQTIDGVPREWVENYAGLLEEHHMTKDAKKVRALLDAPDEKFNPMGWAIDHSAGRPILVHNNCSVIEAEQAYGLLELIKTAAQTQGEPVVRHPDAIIEGVMTSVGITHAIYASTVSLKHGEQVRLYAERPAPFQSRVQPWMMACFGEAIAADRQERNHRFLEEALELVQACGCTATEAHQLVEYVYGRPAGEQSQEVGGVMVTLAALCLAAGLDMHAAGEAELARIWTKVEQIRAKQAAKPAMSPLPGAYPDREQPAPVAVVLPERKPDVNKSFGGTDAEWYGNIGWNSCLDELKRLNPSL